MDKPAARAFAFALAAGIFALDRWTKHLVETRLAEDRTRIVIPGFFNVIHSENRGIAFGIFQEGAFHAQSLILASVALAVIAILGLMLWRTPSTLSLALIFGGAMGNVYDRIRAGHVTDFLDFYAGAYHWYTFNVADASICIGAFLLILGALF
jgi:signal peptidase II